MMYLFIAWIAILIATVFFSIKNKESIFQWIKQFLRQKFGLLQVKEFNISYRRRERSPALIINIEGVHVRIPSPQPSTSKSHPLATYVSLFFHRLPKPAIEFMLNIPIRLFMHIISNNLALHVDDFTIEKNNFLLHIDHTFIDFKSTTGSLPVVYSIGTQIGPIQFYNKVAEKSLVVFEMTTLCLVTLSCHLQKAITRITSKDLDLEIGLGKIDVNINNVLPLLQSRNNSSSSSTTIKAPQWKDHFLNSIRVTVQHICFNFDQVCVKVNSIRSSIQPQLLVTFDTELIECIVFKVPLFTMPSMEIKLSQSDHNDTSSSNTTKSLHAAVPPYTTFVSITWILNSPIIHFPVNHADLMNRLMQNGEKPSASAPLIIGEKVLPNLPMFTFALVVNTPKIQISNTDIGTGYLSTSSLIIRLSGEYMDQDTKNSGSSADTIISSSSSSNLDALFAQEEYQWLKNTRPKRTTATQRWLNLMGRVSHRGVMQQKQQQSDSFEVMGSKKWIYRTSAKIIAQKLNLGYTTLQGKEKEFIRIKNMVIILKMKMMVLPNNDLKQYETIFSFDNSVHSEAALEKPVIYLWNDSEDEPASVFWIKSLPQSISKYKTNSNNIPQEVQPVWIKMLIRNMCFSLDVIKGSIVADSVDRRNDVSPTQPPPQGYFYNTPNEEVYSRLILDTQKFTFACDGPGNSEKSEWKSRCHMENLYIQQTSHVLNKDVVDEDEEKKKQHVLLWISQLNVNAKFLNTGLHKCVSVSAKVKKYGIFYSVRNHYVCLLFAKSLQMIKHRMSSGSNGEKLGEQSNHSLLLELDANVGRGDLQIHLPQNVKLYLRIDDLSIQKGASSSPIVKFRNLMILGVSPLHEGSWEQILEIDKAQISSKHRSDSVGIELKSRKIFASIPYNYVLSAVIENIIGLVKAIKELHSRILSNNSFTYFGPTVNNDPIVIPCIHIKTRVFTIHFDDDPFEAKLRNIFRTGFVEQQKRLAYREALDNRIHEMLSNNLSATATAASDSISSSSVRHEAVMEDTSTYNGTTPSPDMEVYSQIMEANKNLLERYSELWIKNINNTKKKEADFYNDFHIRENYRNSATSDLLDESLDEPQRLESFTFMIDIRPRPLHPPLANFSAHFVKVSFQPVDFSPSETKQFINTIGGGVPLNNDFSIIIPFHLTIKAGRTWIKVRDYPLPLMYVPPPSNGTTATDDNISARSSTRNNSHVSWILEGNYVVGDELGNSGGSRIIPIAIVPSSNCLGYCLSAVRTASPLKFYSVIDYNVFTKSMSTICWSISYNPAIQDIIRVLDSLTASSVDPSPRVGFWDKVRMIIHTRTKITFAGGGDLAIVVKGTRDPYQLQGRGAGLAKVWRNNVVWYLGYKNPQSEFMQFISRNYAFGVPNLNYDGYIPNFPDSLPIVKTAAENNNKFLKVALKLSDGIRMGIGLHYERLACNSRREGGAVCFKCASAHKVDRCRTQEFSPHYNIIYQSVKQVEANYDMNTYDAFEGFRSNFIHLSLSIVKLQNGEVAESPDFSKDDPYFMTSGTVSQNAMYLSPCFIKHFMSWYRLFGSPISLPVRQGKLFPKDEPKSLSFGDHLDTVKYKIVVNPLGIGFFCTDEETYLNVKGGGSAGLKARVNAFSVDLHSRKEVIRVSPPTMLSKDEPSKTEMNFHEVELELHDIDLRVIRSTPVSGVQSDSKSTTTSFYDTASFDDEDEVEEETKYSFQWVDPKDYFILDSVPQRNNTSRRKIDVHPFAFSPLLYYTKQNDEAGTERRQYLRGTHDCIMGKGPDSREFQKAHLHRRASDLDKVIENHDKQLDVILNAMNIVNHHDQETLNQQYEILVQKLDYLRTNRYMLHNYIAQLILETELNIAEPCNNSRDSPNTTTSSICRRNELSRWEMLMGHFRDRFFVHNPQIIWNNSVRDAIYYWQDIKNSRAVQDYNLSARCLKFLEDLVHTAEKQQQWKPDLPSSLSDPEIFTSDIDMDKNVTQELIEKLLSERSHNFVAYNEKEEERARDQPQHYDGIYVEGDSENVNDPDYQYKNIPENYEMKSKYLIDMINPQVNFQSEKGLDHLILFTNERIHVKAFGIIDNSSSGTADKDIRLVKDRIIVSLDNAQLLVAKRMEFLSFNLLTQSSYGQCRNLHWAAWVHPEQLWYYKDVRYFDNFQRVASQLSGTIQLDRYNHLRIKIDKYNTSRKSPFEDRTNTMQLHFPQFKLTLNSQQAHILYYTLINLLLGSDGSPRKKQRLSRFKDVMLAAERSDLAETVKQVGVLQNRSRALLDMHRRFIDQLPNLDSVGMREFNKNRKRMRENLEKLYLVVEAIRSIQTFRRDIHLEETDQAKRFTFTSDEIVWEAVMDDAEQSSLCKWTLINIKYVFLDKQNGSSRNTIEIDTMQIQNTTKSPVFINVLDRFIEPGQTKEPEYSRQKMLRGVLESLPPVGGIPIIQQLEVNLLPLHLQISTAFGTAMKDYFFPSIGGAEFQHNNVGTNSESNFEDVGGFEDSDEDDEDDYYYEEDHDVNTLNVGSRSSSKTDLFSLVTVDKSNASTFSKREGSFASFDLLTQKVKQTVSRRRKVNLDELTVMKKRSSTNRTFIYVRIPATKHCLSLQGPTKKTIYNLYNFTFEQPNLEYRNKTWSMAEMMDDIQKQFLRAILRHSPALLKNKLLWNGSKQASQPKYEVSTTRRIAPAPSIRSVSSAKNGYISDNASTHHHSSNSITDADTIKSNYNTEDEDDVKSLYSVDPEEELERLAESQTVQRRLSINVDKELQSVYMKKYKEEEEADEIVEKGKILFGDKYRRGSFHHAGL